MAKRRWKPNIKQFSLTIFLLGIVCWSIFNIVSSQIEARKLNNELNRITTSIKDIKEKQASVLQEIEKWDDPQLIEEVARKQLGFVRPGETTYMFSESVQPANEKEVTKRSNSGREGIAN
jgi:cell division protein FtsL